MTQGVVNLNVALVMAFMSLQNVGPLSIRGHSGTVTNLDPTIQIRGKLWVATREESNNAQ